MARWSERDEMLRMRLVAHGIGATAAPAEAVRTMLAMQSQDFGAAAWAIGVRSGATDEEVTAAFDGGDIVRSWTMRGTLFSIAADDLAWVLRLTEPRVRALRATRLRQLGIDDAVIARARTLAEGALAGGRDLGRDEFMALLDGAGIPSGDQRGYLIIAMLAQEGYWCWGPVRDGSQRLVLCEEWIGPRRIPERDEALAEFLVRYLAGHGPATLRDFAAWTKLTLGDARRAREIAGDRLVPFGADSWILAGTPTDSDAAARRRFRAGVHALPGFDEYYLGYAERSAFIDAEHENAVVPGANGVFKPTIVSGGRVVGTWRRVSSSRGIRLEAQPFATLSPAEAKGFDAAARRYARFAGRPLAPTG